MQRIIDGSADLKPRMTFVAPLDPINWDKSLVLALWDFQYAWEIYTPAAKRKYGYCVLPILYGDRFVGRIEAVADCKEKVLRVKGLWWEPGVRQTKKLEAALDQALKRFCKFNECKEVSMETIMLTAPELKYAEEIWAFRKEILERDAENENQFAGCLSLDDSSSAEEWIRICDLRKREETCMEVGTQVPSHTYLAIRVSDNRLVGIIDLRHHINHPILGTWGGHCGYSVRPSERGKGYAKEMLRLNVQNAKKLGIEKMLVTCDADNAASEKTILANGGVFEKTIDVEGTEMKRYWITVM